MALNAALVLTVGNRVTEVADGIVSVAAHDEDTMIFAFQNEAQHNDQSQHFCARSGMTFLCRL